METERPDLDRLLEHAGWARALGGQLAGANEADDLLQEVWVHSLRSGGAARRPAAWLAGVVRHLAARSRRGDARRQHRERAAARPEAQPGPDELAKSAEAIASLFPDVFLGIALGFESERPGDLFTGASQAWNAGPSLLTPLFHGGILRAAVTARDAQERQAWLRYEQAVLGALGQVEDALAAWREAGLRRDARTAARDAEVRAEGLPEERYRAGLASGLEVLDATRARLEAERGVLAARTERCLAAIALVGVLGGGWESAEGEAAALAAAR
jgi:hypothetical protein